MNNTIPNTARHLPRISCRRRLRGNAIRIPICVFALGVVLLVCGGAITGHHEVTMIGLGLIIFSSLFR